ncbi:MAG: hypothetical protein EP333_09835 [Bacteroidetes bacterium]|nr:MAG: hypothetical protein EP333_09835 [Bacteroidota bacterium]
MLIRIVFFCASLFFLFSCNKWKQPTDTRFYCDINRAATLDDQLTFTGGQIILSSFVFEGERKKGDDVFFEQQFNNGLVVPFDLNNTVQELNFDIPQGVYVRIELVISTTADNESITVYGNYQYTSGDYVPFVFVFTDSEEFEVEAENEDGGDILLDKDQLSRAKIIIDPSYWFSPVPKSFFEGATLTNINGINTILIDKNSNEDIYDIVLDRLKDNTKAIFNF